MGLCFLGENAPNYYLENVDSQHAITYLLGKLYLEIKSGYCRLDTFKCAMKSGEKANPLPKCP